MLLIQDYNYQLLSSMDNIAIGVNALCCLLPFLAFILLTLQFFRNLPLSKTQAGNFAESYDEFPCTMGGLISIKNQVTFREVQNSACCVSPQKTPSNNEKCQYKDDNQYLNETKKQTQQFGSKILAGCSVGLVKMIYINKVYFRKSKVGDCLKSCKEQRKRKPNSSIIRGCFEPTRLVTIVEGLQY